VNKIKRKFSFILSIALTIIINLDSYGNGINFYHLNTSNGLSQNTVNFIHQDLQGFFWFGTNGGLNKWNGYDFTTYSYSTADSNSIGQGRINCIHEDENGELWIGTYQGGVSKFNRSSNTFENFYNFDLENKNDQSNNIQQINKYNNFIITGTFGNGIYLLNAKTKKYIPIKIFNEHNQLMSNLIINKILIDIDSTLWIGFTQGALKIPKQDWNENAPELHGQEILKGEYVLTIYRDSKNQVWFGTHYSGAICLNLSNNKLFNLNDNALAKGQIFPIVRDFIEDKYKNLWIGMGGGGIIIMNNETQTIKLYKSALNNSSSLSSNIIYCLHGDKSQNIWIGTYNSGVDYTNSHKQTFNHIRGFGGENELKNNAILSLCELSNQTIMVGTDGGGISIYNPKDGTFKASPFADRVDPSKISVPVTIARDHNGNVLIGTFLNGLYVYNEKTRKLKNYKAGANKYDLQSNNIWAITISRDNTIWIGTLGKGIAKFDPVSEKFYNYYSQSNVDHSISEDYISSLLVDHKNTLWVATYNGGINMLVDEEKGIFKSFKKGDASELTSNEIWKLFEDSKNNLWAATHDGGICILNRETMTFRVLTKNDGLASNSAQSIIEDKNGTIWIGSNNGLSRITMNGDKPIIKNYSDHNGLQSNEFNSNATLVSENNILYFGGSNGFNYFSPDSLNMNEEVGPIIITNFLSLYHDNTSGKSTSIFNTRNIQTNTIDLKYNIALITIEYAMLDYTIPELNSYKYKLEGFDKAWVNAGFNRNATYTNLNPGTYIFKVKGTNSLGVENQKEGTIKFVIHPPFWKKPWFISTYILLFVLLTILFYRLKVRSYRLQEISLKSKVDKRTTELVEVNKVLAERNHEIKLQSEELSTKSEHLIEVNTNLERSYEQIEKQNAELEHHRNNLELLVEKRTEELEHAKDKAEESERLKMAFLSNMSHEIRTPMNAIMGFSSLLSIDGYSNEEKKTFSDLINSNSNSLLLLIDDILDLSRIEANQLNVVNTKINFIEIINETVANWTIISKEKYPDAIFKFENNIAEKELIIESDYTRIKQIINNLIDNALKFTCVGTVTVIVWIENNYLLTCVQDTGIGISAESIPIIFDRFRKSEDSLDKNFRGAGLGLTISKKLATLLEGDLWAVSDFGRGSKFYLKIPIQKYQS